jgi:hypothetical protein
MSHEIRPGLKMRKKRMSLKNLPPQTVAHLAVKTTESLKVFREPRKVFFLVCEFYIF